MIDEPDLIAHDKEEYYDSETEPSIIEENNVLDENEKANCYYNKQEKVGNDRLIYAVQFINNIDSSNKFFLNSKTIDTPINHNRIFINAESAKNLCKQDPDNRRFKVFRNFIDAYSFSYNESEIKSGSVPSIAQLKESLNKFEIESDIANKQVIVQYKTQDVEKLPFPAPKKSEINLLRSHIEKNEVDLFKNKVLANPRYLISSGDAPIIVQVIFLL
jgi:hypothetical protein